MPVFRCDVTYQETNGVLYTKGRLVDFSVGPITSANWTQLSDAQTQGITDPSRLDTNEDAQGVEHINERTEFEFLAQFDGGIVINSPLSGSFVIDDDTMATATDTVISTSESIKAYVDSIAGATDMDFAGDTGTGVVMLTTEVFSIISGTGIDTTASGQTLTVAMSSSFADGDIPFADALGELISDGTQLGWDTGKEQLLVGTSDTSGFQKVKINNEPNSASDVAALSLYTLNSGAGSDVAIQATGVNLYNYSPGDVGDDVELSSSNMLGNDTIDNAHSLFIAHDNLLHNGSADLTGTDIGGLVGSYRIITSNSPSGATVARAVGEAVRLGTGSNGILTTGVGVSLELRPNGGDITSAIGMEFRNDAVAGTVTDRYAFGFDTTSDWISDNSLPVLIDGLTRWIPTYETSPVSGAYSLTFVDGDLTADELAINHNLGQQALLWTIMDNSGNVVVPTEVTFDDDDNATLDFTGLTPLSGTWTAILSIGNPAVGDNVKILSDTEIQIFNAQDLIDASGGTFTITVDGASLVLTFETDDQIVSPVKINAINGASVTIQATGQGTWVWSNVGTMITSVDSTIRIRGMNLAGFANLSSPFSASLIDFSSSSNTANTLNISRCNLLYWVGGTHDTGIFLMRFVGLIDWFGPFELTNSGIVEFQSITIGKIDVPVLGQIAISILSSDPESVIKMTSASGRIDAGDYFLRVDPLFNAKFLLNGVVSTGTLFNETGSDGTFTAIADATITALAIDSVEDSATNPGTARFVYTPGATVYEFQEVAISGYTVNTDYNDTGIITETGTGWFEISSIDWGSDEGTGQFDSDTITLTTAATTLSDGDTLYIDGQYSIDIDGGTYVYNFVSATSFQINAAYPGATTFNGTWCTNGLDERNSRVIVSTSPGQSESDYRAFVHIEDNDTTGSETTTALGVYNVVSVSGATAAITAYATNGLGGTTVTSAGVGALLIDLQNVTIPDSGDATYNASWTIFNVATNSFDIGVAFATDPADGNWNTGPIVGSSMERFKLTDPDTMEITYIGREERSFTAGTTIGAVKTGAARAYQFSNALNGVVTDGASYSPRTLSAAISSVSHSQDFTLNYADTIVLKQAAKTSADDIIVENLRQEIS